MHTRAARLRDIFLLGFSEHCHSLDFKLGTMYSPTAMTTMLSSGIHPCKTVASQLRRRRRRWHDYEDVITSHHHALPVHSWGHGMATSTTTPTTKKAGGCHRCIPELRARLRDVFSFLFCWAFPNTLTHSTSNQVPCTLPATPTTATTTLSSTGIRARKIIASPTKTTATTVVSGSRPTQFKPPVLSTITTIP